jgi:nitroimidazol reductase NimA-like FMN-containing flavoprotein (pyridoxamine 5'-phosphate oxidase superfamily)
MHNLRRKDKAIADETEVKAILQEAKHVTLALSLNNEPYLVTLSHVFDEERNCIYFHCAREGRKIGILKVNSSVWGQALIDNGYQQGDCDYFYRTAQFHGKVTFVDEPTEKEYALRTLIEHLDNDAETIIKNQITPHSMGRITIGRIDIDFMSGKKAEKVIVQL